MLQGLDKAIKNFILPQFPWVTSYKVEDSWEEDGITHFNVVYYLDADEDGTYTVTKDFGDLEDVTLSTFDMLNDNNHELHHIFFRKNR